MGIPAAATLAVATAVPVAGVTSPDAAERATSSTTAGPATGTKATERAYFRTVSRSADRLDPGVPRLSEVQGLAEELAAPLDLERRWVTTDLNVWTGPGEDTRLVTVLDSGAKVAATGTVRGRWAQIARNDRLLWVRKAYLAREKPPETGTGAGVSGAPCPDGSSVESGLSSNTIAVYRSVCAAFPAVTSWGGLSGSGDHGAGLALDIMVTGSMGDAIADYVRAHAGELGVSYVIWAQRIWTVERSSEGWRYMSDRGSTTANHYDHVHVSVF